MPGFSKNTVQEVTDTDTSVASELVVETMPVDFTIDKFERVIKYDDSSGNPFSSRKTSYFVGNTGLVVLIQTGDYPNQQLHFTPEDQSFANETLSISSKNTLLFLGGLSALFDYLEQPENVEFRVLLEETPEISGVTNRVFYDFLIKLLGEEHFLIENVFKEKSSFLNMKESPKDSVSFCLTNLNDILKNSKLRRLAEMAKKKCLRDRLLVKPSVEYFKNCKYSHGFVPNT